MHALTLRPVRSPVMLGAALGGLLALTPAVLLGAGIGATDMLEACRAVMGGINGVMPCAGH